MKHVAFLRGMNLGRRRVDNARLRTCFEAMGLDDVAVFLASGNVVFDSRLGPSRLRTRIQGQLRQQLGFDVPTVLRTADEVRTIAAHQPFATEVLDRTAGKLQVVLLATKPTAARKNAALALASDADHLACRGRELYWLPVGNLSDSQLNLERDADLGLMTVRTHRTIVRLVAKLL